ncbi:Suppressor-of-White-APricot/surp domain-containing protein / D111/G-patch domain-containing protein [Prunus dulcis]|uniref:Suppressor-of-White-APricot/surp domain-containing protein / D111/G-patch domain-containing protein n=1 Tax=Prunus dulcis TaxID=3755 RepID=A0A4Y1QWU4_PRUDU|nr:Suppressor-of-White-APricot/surp domain-containing protein / D111/G-patch domain-containing protein [Prunus dulcis]
MLLSKLGYFPMDKGVTPSLFVNDGSFMERFKQLQQEKEKDKGPIADESTPSKVVSGSLTPNLTLPNDTRKAAAAASGGKLAFSLKQKSKIVAPPVKLGADEDEDEADAANFSADAPTKRQKLGQPDASEESPGQVDVAPPSPNDSTVKIVADKLASFVLDMEGNLSILHVKEIQEIPLSNFYLTRAVLITNIMSISLPLRRKSCNRSSILKHLVMEVQTRPLPNPQHPNYQTPASALYDATEGRTGELTAPTGADPIAMMEYYVKKAAQEERKRQPKQSKDEMPPPASLQAPSLKKGHHMGDYIPQEELEKFMAACNDAASQKAAKEAADRAKIQADNVGHKLLSKMGWKEGEGLGSSRRGISDPIMAGNVKKDNLGVGAQQPGEVTPEDDIYEQYKKRMMLGYRYRPNPLVKS